MRLRLSVACGALVVAGAGCAALLDLPAPELGDGGDPREASPLEASSDVTSSDVTSSDVLVPVDGTVPETGSETGRDAAADRTSQDVAPETAADAEQDQSSDAPSGVLCGLAGQLCDPATQPTCCQTPDDAGMPSFSCVATTAMCTTYVIECANDGDCADSDICCHYSSGMRCETPTMPASTCPGSGVVQACDPDNVGECPQDQACTAHLVNQGMASPYWGCE